MNESRELWPGQQRSRLATVDSWLSLMGGGALTAFGLQRAITKKSPMGIAMAAGGGALLYNGLRTHARSNGVHIQTAFTINKSPGEVYRQWRQLENLPQFMKHLETVRQLDHRRSEWTGRGPFGRTFTWQAEILDEQEGRFLVWRSLAGSPIETSGSVEFREAPGGRGTELIVAMHYSAIGKHIGKTLTELLGAVPERVLREEVRSFKQLIEAGEIPTTKGQPSGRRGTVVSLADKVMHMPARRRTA